MKRNSKFLALALSVVMSVSAMGITVFADQVKETEKTTEVEKEIAEDKNETKKETKTKEETEKNSNIPTDVMSDAWYYEFVLYSLENGYMTGVSETEFAPQKTATRAEVYQLLYNAEDKPEVSETSFGDAKGKWYETSAAWAEETKLTSGTDGGLYNGDANVTRQEIAAIFWNYAEFNSMVGEKADLSKFVDEEEISNWAKDSVAYAVGLNLITGKDGNILDPKGNTTRAELSTLVKKFFTDEPETEKPETEKPEENKDILTGKIVEVSKYGNITVGITSKFLKEFGFELGDILTVTAKKETVNAPFGSSYSDVNNGNVVVRGAKEDEKEENNIIIAINMGDFAKTYDVAVGDEISLAIKEKAGYLDEYEIRQLERTNERSDYSSDQVFANFRNVKMGNIAEGLYYRSSSPINNELNRAPYADKFTKEAGVVTVINLADSKEEYNKYILAEDFNSPYYKELYDDGQVILLDMGVDFTAQDFKDKLKIGLEFMAKNEGPFLVHCNEGKDRAGFAAALIEALMGGTVEEIKEDYLVTYINYYHVEKGSEQYNKIAESNILESLRSIAGLESGADLKNVDLAKAAEKYIKGIGVSQEDIDTIKKTLSTPIALDNAA